MNGEVFRILTQDEVDRIVNELAHQTFVDGKVSAAGIALEVKNNLQVERLSGERNEIDSIVVSAFERQKDFQAYAMPRRFAMPIYSRYEPGMRYGDHVDNALMGGFNGIRSDLAITIFLSPPESYDGGELVIAGGDEVKLNCGEAFVYSASSIHHVAPITRGVRLAVVTWIQSAIRDERLRTVIHDLARAGHVAEPFKSRELSLILSKSYHNLVRFAAET